jgi:hypothetical protein
MIEAAALLLGSYLFQKALGPIDRDVDERMQLLWSRVKGKLRETPQGDDAVGQITEHPADPKAQRVLEQAMTAASNTDSAFAGEVENWLEQEVDQEVVALWIATDTGIPLETARRVFAVEYEYMEGVGITDGAIDNFVYYRNEDLASLPRNEMDVAQLAADAGRFLGLPPEIPEAVLDGETRYLQLRGIAGPEEET